MSCKSGPIVESCTLNVPLSALIQANWQFGAFIGLALVGGMKWFHMHVEAGFGCVVLHTAFPPAGWVRVLASSLRSGCWQRGARLRRSSGRIRERRLWAVSTPRRIKWDQRAEVEPLESMKMVIPGPDGSSEWRKTRLLLFYPGFLSPTFSQF